MGSLVFGNVGRSWKNGDLGGKRKHCNRNRASENPLGNGDVGVTLKNDSRDHRQRNRRIDPYRIRNPLLKSAGLRQKRNRHPLDTEMSPCLESFKTESSVE